MNTAIKSGKEVFGELINTAKLNGYTYLAGCSCQLAFHHVWAYYVYIGTPIEDPRLKQRRSKSESSVSDSE